MSKTCPIHGTQKIQGPNSRGNYWCAMKPGIGQPNTNASGYCNCKLIPLPGTPQEPAQAPQASSPAPTAYPPTAAAPGASSGPSRGELACAALQAAVTLADSATPLDSILGVADAFLYRLLVPASEGRPTDVANAEPVV